MCLHHSPSKVTLSGNILSVDINGKRLVQYTYGYDYEENEDTGGMYKYDSYLVRVNYANGGNIRYQYEDMEVLSVVEDEKGNTETMTNVEHKLAYVKINGKATDSSVYSYNQYGNVTKYVDSETGVTYTYNYDSKQNLKSITGDNGFVMETSSTDSVKDDDGKTSYSTDTTWGIGDVKKSVHYEYSELNNVVEGKTDLITGDKVIVKEDSSKKENNIEISGVASWNISSSEKSANISYSDDKQLIYKYNENGNIDSIYEKDSKNSSEELVATYEYDLMGQLIRENNKELGQTIVYAYDENGNIVDSTSYNYTQGQLLESIGRSHTWKYEDDTWRDKLTSYDGKKISYDASGNPVKYYDGKTFSWESNNMLSKVEDDKKSIFYKYNDSYIRTKKIVTDKESGNTLTYEYYLDNYNNVIAETKTDSSSNSDTIWYAYSGEGELVGFQYKEKSYYYKKNLQNDIIGIYNETGKVIVEYSYDAWGNCTIIKDDSNIDLSKVNSFRYRGYYFDEDTGFYYVQSRYYDSEIKRFISADDINYLGEQGINCNLYSYCANDPVNQLDIDGHISSRLVGAISNAIISVIFDFIMQKFVAYLKGKSIKIDKVSLIREAIIGAVGGVLMTSRAKKIIQMIGGGLLNSIKNIVNCAINRKLTEAKVKQILVDFAIGAVWGCLSGDGLASKYYEKGLFGKGWYVYKGKRITTRSHQLYKEGIKEFARALSYSVGAGMTNAIRTVVNAFR